MRVVESNFDGLVETFGSTRRLASRVGALARLGILLTETVIEFAVEPDGQPLAKLILSKRLLDAAEHLDSETLEVLAAKSEAAFFTEHPLTLVARGERQVLCLAEEADEAVETAGATSGKNVETSLASVVDSSALPALIARDEARRLLGSEEISRLKLDLITSADAGRRLEAVRKLWLAELPQDEKLRLFLAALRDRDADVRSEAARALGGCGLDAGLTENIAKASRGSVEERVVAIGNLQQVFPRLDAAQQRLALGVLIEFVSPSEEKEIVQSALGVTATRLGETEGAEALTFGLHKQLIELLQVRQSLYEDAARKVYAALYKRDPKRVSGLLAETVDEVSQEPLRFFALSLICEHDLESAANPKVIERLVDGLCAGSELEKSYQTCVGALVRLADHAVDPLIARLKNSDDAGRRRTIGLLGHMLREESLGGDAGLRVVEACRELYGESTPEVRETLLESEFYSYPGLSPEVMGVLARAFIEDLHEFRFERQIELLETAIHRCGHVAVEPLHTAVRESAYDVTRLSAARLLPEIVAEDAEITKQEIEALIDSMKAMILEEESEFPDRGPLFIALGRFGAHSKASERRAATISEFLREQLGRSSAVYDVLEALGYLAAGANLSAAQRIEVGYVLLNVLTTGLPKMSGRIRLNAEGEQVLHFGRETTAYTDMVPRILEALGRLVQAKKTPDALYKRVSRELVQLWREITEYKRIWAPAATLTLARLLGELALGSRCRPEQADEISELLARKLILMPVMQVLTKLLARAKGGRLDRLAAEVFHEVSKRLVAEPQPDATERRQILETMVAVAKRERLGVKEGEIDYARRQVVEALFDGIKARVFGARRMLEELVAAPQMSESLRADVERRLKPLAGRR